MTIYKISIDYHLWKIEVSEIHFGNFLELDLRLRDNIIISIK